MIDIGAGPQLCDVRYYFTPDDWPDPPRSLFPLHYQNPWWDAVQGDASRWTPGTPPVWQDGSIPSPIDACPCWDGPLDPPCSVSCGQLPVHLTASSIAYSGSSFVGVPISTDAWDPVLAEWRFTFTAFGETVASSFRYAPLTDRWTVHWSIDGDVQTPRELNHFIPCDSSDDLVSTGGHTLVQWSMRVLGPWD